jgi:FlaA1/EpsC-like NDP-sugar epimerase
MTRYWMTMDEAVWLLLVAATRARPADILMLADLNEISVLSIAGRLSDLLGYGSKPEVRLIGMRPGERLREELLSANESFVSSGVEGIACVAHEHRKQQLDTHIPSFKHASEMPSLELTSEVMDLARTLQ